jgi:hypothetical protein
MASTTRLHSKTPTQCYSISSTPNPECLNPLLEYDPEKWEPVFRKDHAPAKCLGSHSDSTSNNFALAAMCSWAGFGSISRKSRAAREWIKQVEPFAMGDIDQQIKSAAFRKLTGSRGRS